MLTDLIDPINEQLWLIIKILELYTDDQLKLKTKEEMIKIIKDLQNDLASTAIKKSQRKKRVDFLVDLARTEMQSHHNESLTVEKLDNEISSQWSLSSKLKEEYILEVDKLLEYNHGIVLHASKYLGKLKQDLGLLQGKQYAKLSKMQFFFNILKSLEGEEKSPVEYEKLKNEMVKTGRFSEDEAITYIERMSNEARIYESKPGYYNRT